MNEGEITPEEWCILHELVEKWAEKGSSKSRAGQSMLDSPSVDDAENAWSLIKEGEAYSHCAMELEQELLHILRQKDE